MQKVAFGGGCHWCTEAIFQSLCGVNEVEQGWISSTLPDASTPSEAVILHYDEEKIKLEVLIEIHLFTHSSTANHALRKKYRSAIYTFSKVQQNAAQEILKTKQELFDKPIVTKVYPFGEFRLNNKRYLNYYKNKPQKPFCQVRIKPKIQILLEKFSDYTKS